MYNAAQMEDINLSVWRSSRFTPGKETPWTVYIRLGRANRTDLVTVVKASAAVRGEDRNASPRKKNHATTR
jgi:hypothetical protein